MVHQTIEFTHLLFLVHIKMTRNMAFTVLSMQNLELFVCHRMKAGYQKQSE